MRLEHINLGSSERLHFGDRSQLSGIQKHSVDREVFLGELGVDGDAVVDEVHHGGKDQAVYAYSADDYDWWSEQLDAPCVAGLFGENLTIRGLPSDMNIGDRLLLGEVVLEATSPRIPCSTLAMRMQDSSFGLAFRKAERPGIYFRVLNAGHITPGDTITYVASDDSDVGILDLFRFNYATQHDAATLQRYLDVPLAERMRTKVQSRLDALPHR